jgi:predicted phage replisome organizer
MDVKWIKVSTSMFESSRKIKQIEVMPEGDTILVIWLKLLLLAGNVNDHGAIYITPEIPYTDEMLANELRRPLTTVRMALSVFETFGMIEIVDNIYYLSAWDKYQNTDKLAEMREYNREAQRRSRERRKALCGVNDMSMTCQPCQDTEEEREKEKDLEFHSITPAHKKEQALEKLGGSLGKGVVMLSEEQMDDLLDKLSLDEFNKYVSIVADCELKGKRYKKKSHYQAILDMAAKDRKVG